MESSYSSRSRFSLLFLFFVGAFLQLTNAKAGPRLEDVIEEAERESKIIANEINRWLLTESGSLLKGDEEVHIRSHRSIDEDDEDKQSDTNFLSKASQLIVKRDVENNAKKYHKKESGVPARKNKIKKARSDPVAKGHHQNARKRNSIRVIKKQGLVKHHTKKGGGKDKADDKGKLAMDELSKARLVKALIEGDSEPKKDAGVSEQTYKELAEFIASSDQYTIETGSKKSLIPRPVSKAHAKGTHIKLTKKHKRVLDILSKLAPNVLRKYFHQKGLDKYWKVMENIKKIHAAKRNNQKKKFVDNSKDIKAVKQGSKIVPPKKQKLSSELKHPENDALLKMQTKSQENFSKIEYSKKKKANDKAIRKLHKHDVLRNSSQEAMVVKSTEEKRAKKSKKEVAIAIDHVKKQQHQTVVEPSHQREIPQPQKDEKKNLFKVINSKNITSKEKKNEKLGSEKSLDSSAESGSHVQNAVANSVNEKHEAPRFKDVPKQERQKKVSGSVIKKTAHAKKINGDAKDLSSSANQAKMSTSKNVPKTLEKSNQVFVKQDSSTHQIKNRQQEKAPQFQVKSGTKNTTRELTNKNISDAENHKDTAKTPSGMEHHVIKWTHARQLESKHNESLEVKEEHPASGKINYLKEKIRKTNNLKFKVAQALLAHCETKNRLRKVFDDVNSSLKKAAVLAQAIGKKFGIQQNDIDKITSYHTEGAVEQFLNKLF
ncbi:unnamed protein product [Porites evermanni]|uniref:Uncharacterized protein n=1 Tax=Porites evermanni TaxID=104178 RepID=A0ABN8M1W3_9CNID|nr:unnamed protein product [Porites evermanni]